MKNLTHYFTSPKEEESATKISSTLIEISENNEKSIQNDAREKRKISLSKKKTAKNENQIPESETKTKKDSCNENNLTNSNDKIKKIAKRKTIDGKISEENILKSKKMKLGKSETPNPKLVKSDSIVETDFNSAKNGNNKVDCKENMEDIISIQSSSNSCDEPLAKTKRNKFNKSLFLESVEDTTPCMMLDSRDPSNRITENSVVGVKIVNGARNSLLGYFNKIDKETALKEKKPDIIKVEALVHLPPIERDNKPSPCVPSKPSKKTKHRKTKQTSDYDSIEILSSENISNEDSSVNVEICPKTECNTLVNNDVNEEIKTVQAKPINFASIFINKKAEKKEASSAMNNLFNNENLPLPEKDVKSEELKNDKQIKQKKSLKIKKQSKTFEQDNKIIQNSNNSKKKSISGSSEENSSKKCKQLLSNKSDVVSDDSNSKVVEMHNIQSHETNIATLSQSSAIVCTAQEDKVKTEEMSIVTINQDSVNKTPEKLKACKADADSTNLRNSKQKSCKINGYFTPKMKNSGSIDIKEIGEEVCKNKKSPSAWVMKVRLSATKSVPGSDNDDETRESIQEEKQELSEEVDPDNTSEEIGTPGPKEEDNHDIIILDDEDDSNSSKDQTCRRRISLPRSAKTLKFASEENSQSPKPPRLPRSAKTLKYATEEKSETSKPSVKMWPFFQKGGARQAKDPPVDQEKLKAKLLFLESGVPEVLKRKVEIEKSEGSLGSPAPFPAVTHVTQTDAVCTKETCAPSLLPRQRCPSPPPTVPAWSLLPPVSDFEEPEIPVFGRPENVKACLEKLKDEDPKTEVKTLFKCLKEYKRKADSDIWTEVYKPYKSADIVGNSENIKKLKTWLETFKNCRRREGSVSSGDEFVNEDSDGEGNSVNNLAVVSGPYGCGKTCAVYAIAAELDCKVLEMNASCNRSGKRILAEFSESTQSHQVERSQPTSDLFNNERSGKLKKKRKLKKLSEAKSEKTSLILVEDADLLFTDADEGYMQALSSLAATAKRPIILVTNQTRNPHLDRFESSRPLHLTFSKPKASKIELWLRLVGLVEGVEVTADQAKCLVAWSGCDLRRALLQLQLMVHSNNSELKEKLTQSKLWWQWPLDRGLQYELPTLLEAEELPQPPQVDKAQLLRELKAVSLTTSRLAYLDILSVRCSHQMLGNEEKDPCCTYWKAECWDSTAQTQCLLGPVHSTSTQLADWLAETVAKERNNMAASDRPAGQTAQEARWLSILRQSEQMFLSGVSSTLLSNHRAVACEYLPILREMGRTEQVRLTNYSRRANRFFNYLQGLGIHASKSYRDFMCDAFS